MLQGVALFENMCEPIKKKKKKKKKCKNTDLGDFPNCVEYMYRREL